MGLRDFGPIDGHDLSLLISTLEFAKNFHRPIFLHLLPKKGKRLEAPLNNPEKFHGHGAYDCIVHDAALQDLPVIFCMDRAGLSPQDGPTHHGLFDIAYVRSVPNCIAMAPKDEDELVDMMFTATHEPHPAFIRYPRGPAEGLPVQEQPRLIEIGKAEVIQNFSNNRGRKVALFALGNMMGLARKAAVQLAAEGYDIAIVNPRFIKPLDAGATQFFGNTADVVVTLEDH